MYIYAPLYIRHGGLVGAPTNVRRCFKKSQNYTNILLNKNYNHSNFEIVYLYSKAISDI